MEEEPLPSSLTFPAIDTPSKLPQQMLTDSDGEAVGPAASSQQTLPSLALASSSEPTVPLLESQDLQTVEVDVVSSDSSSDLNTSFGSLPTSKFTLEPSRELHRPKSAVVEPLPVLVPPSSAVGVKQNHTSAAANTLLNHRAVLEASTKGAYRPTGLASCRVSRVFSRSPGSSEGTFEDMALMRH